MATNDFEPRGGLVVPTSEERTQALLIWVLTIFAGFIPGLIFLLVSKDKPYVYRQAALALTGSIVWVVCMVISAILMVVLIGILTYLLTFLWLLFVCIKGAIACNNGEDYSPGLISEWTLKLFRV